MHDIVHPRTADGWSLAVSTYEKFRLVPSPVRTELTTSGFTLVGAYTQNGLVTLPARR